MNDIKEETETTEGIEMYRIERLAERDDRLGRVAAAILDEGSR